MRNCSAASDYNQKITIRTNEVLVLTEKNTSVYITILSDGVTNGLGIVLIGLPDYLAVVSSTNYFFHGLRPRPTSESPPQA